MRIWLIELHTAKELSQNEIADICEISQSSYASIESGARQPDMAFPTMDHVDILHWIAGGQRRSLRVYMIDLAQKYGLKPASYIVSSRGAV